MGHGLHFAGDECSRGSMGTAASGGDDRGMPSSTRIPTRAGAGHCVRDPANELYDRACDLVGASAALRIVAARQNNDAAVAATLNCLETALEDVATSVDLLRAASASRIAGAWPVLEDASAIAERAEDRFSDVSAAMRLATRRCSELRRSVGPLLAELNAV